MAVFNTTEFIATDLKNVSGVMNEAQQHFEAKGYETEAEESSFGGFISITKGGIFKAILGMKTALNIDIKVVTGGISVSAKVGVFGQQLIPSLISWFVAWPVLLAQITGLVQQAKLDDEAISVIKEAVSRETDGRATPAMSAECFCTKCGAKIMVGSAFCSVCGGKQA